MMQPLYIRSACAISPQHTFNAEAFLQPAVSSDNGKLFVQDPDYTRYISPVAIRRMSRIIKMGISAGMKCLQQAGISIPTSIITGTSRGSITDMEYFLKSMIETNEGTLNPTYFIQSTYNSINGWLALQTKATCYNQTYVHRGTSFELALLDAQMLLSENEEVQYILAGGFDELTNENYIVKSNNHCWKTPPADSLSLFGHADTPGTIAGEGANFFLFSNEQADAACAVIAVKPLHLNDDGVQMQNAIAAVLSENHLQKEDIDIMLCGINGDSNVNMPFFNTVIDNCAGTTTIAAFKHLCGEYDTATGFALWLANHICMQNKIPGEIIYKAGSTTSIKNILICNKSLLNDASVILVQALQ